MGRPTQAFLKLAARLIALPVVLFLVSCHPAPVSQPAPGSHSAPSDADAKAVLGFLNAYGHRDLEDMMRYLEEDAVFRGSGAALTKPQIRDFFQTAFQKHPKLRVEVGPLKEVQGTIHASVKVETEALWADTWIFEMKNHRIHAYSLASGKR